MHEIQFQSMLLGVQGIDEQMLLSWHVVSLVPVCLPLSKDWEPRLNLKRDAIIFPFGVRGTDVSDVVVVVQACDILW